MSRHEIYRKIIAEESLSGLRKEVYVAVYNYGPGTIGEICKFLNRDRSETSYSPRFVELEKMGIIETKYKKKCSSSGREVSVWQVTEKIAYRPKIAKRTRCNKCHGQGYVDDAGLGFS